MSPKLTSKKVHTGGKRDIGKLSPVIIEFARPLLDAVGKPRHLDELASLMELAGLCWNIPVLQRTGGEQVAGIRRHFDARLDAMPEPVRSILVRMLESRESEYGHVPFLVRVEVSGASLQDCRIFAETRRPSPQSSGYNQGESRAFLPSETRRRAPP